MRSGLGPGVPVGEGVWRVLKGVEGLEGFGGFASLCLEARLEACLEASRKTSREACLEGLGSGGGCFFFAEQDNFRPQCLPQALPQAFLVLHGQAQRVEAHCKTAGIVAILAQGTHWALAAKQALLYFSMSQTSKTHSFILTTIFSVSFQNWLQRVAQHQCC